MVIQWRRARFWCGVALFVMLASSSSAQTGAKPDDSKTLGPDGGAATAWPLAAYGQQDDRIRALQGRILLLQAEGAATKIGQFIKEIESQLGWTTQLPWTAGSIEQRRFDALRLLRQVPAITELTQVDATGKERLRVSRLAMDVVASGGDFSNDPKFTEAAAKKVYYGPVYFGRESEPYMRSLSPARGATPASAWPRSISS
jgi:hypothetical protein